MPRSRQVKSIGLSIRFSQASWKAALPCALDVEIDVIEASPSAAPICMTTLLNPEPNPASASGTSDMEMVSRGKKDMPPPAPSSTSPTTTAFWSDSQ